MTVADIVVTFEGTYTSYLSDYTAPAWVRNYAASRFWHIIFSAVSAADLQRVIALSQARRAGYVFVTYHRVAPPLQLLYPRVITGHSEVTLVYVSRTRLAEYAGPVSASRHGQARHRTAAADSSARHPIPDLVPPWA